MFDVAIENRTPFDAATHVQMDRNGQEVLLAIVSATFAAGAEGSLELAAEQVPVCFADEPLGEPGRSSIKTEADVALSKPKIDVVVTGAAYAPQGKAASEVMVRLGVANINKTLRISGDRGALGLGRAKPFVRMPVVYERAFGGTTDGGDAYVENPVGLGYKGAKPLDPTIDSEAPNIEYPNNSPSGRGDHSTPAGFGVIARHWSPRVKFAGTYNQAWIDSVWPLPPKDFNPLFNQVAPPDQQLASLTGGELVALDNMTPSGLWQFRLPRLDFPTRLIFEDRVEDRELRVDTILIDAEARTVTLKSRCAIVNVRNAPRLREIALGHLTSAWLTARQKGKEFRDLRGGDGSFRDRSTFQL